MSNQYIFNAWMRGKTTPLKMLLVSSHPEVVKSMKGKKLIFSNQVYRAGQGLANNGPWPKSGLLLGFVNLQPQFFICILSLAASMG